MNFSIGARIVLGFAIALLALLLLGGLAYRNLESLNSHAISVVHTHGVLQELQRTRTLLAEAQNASRGYALSGDEILRTRFAELSLDLQRSVRALRTQTADNPSQQEHLDQLEPVISDRLKAAQTLIDTRDKTTTQDDPAVLAAVRDGRAINVTITKITTQLGDEENRLLAIREQQAAAAQQLTRASLLYGTLGAFIFVALASLALTRSIRVQLQELLGGAGRLSRGDYAGRVTVRSKDEIGQLAVAFNDMAQEVQQRQEKLASEAWLKTNLERFSTMFEGQRDLATLGPALLRRLAALLNAQYGVMYLRNGDTSIERLDLLASYAADAPPASLVPGQGLVGQVFSNRQRLVLNDVPEEYVRINSALGSARPRALAVVPAALGENVKAVIELASLTPFTDEQLALLDQLGESLALVLTTIQAGNRTQLLLTQSQDLTQELTRNAARLRASEELLKQQQEELKQANEELEQANEELQQANEEMEERATLLAEQKQGLERSNREVEEGRRALERQSAQLALTSQYKSQFLANMSHELRTPLNSLLILSKVLADNHDSNLTPKQVQHARTIHASGNDLLELINEVLDLSKIEAGAVDLDVSEMRYDAFAEFIGNTFQPIADNRKLQFGVRVDPQLTQPRAQPMCSDIRRVQQIVKNLVSNALKFTHEGSVRLSIRPARHEWQKSSKLLDAADQVIAFEVSDTGIGIPESRLQLIFEAFQQADAGTSRKYGGTGLGLSISRELAQRLGGALEVRSEIGKGSTFTLYLPREISHSQLTLLAGNAAQTPAVTVDALTDSRHEHRRAVTLPELEPPALDDDRDILQPGDLTLLAIEDDVHFAQVIAQFARNKGFKVILAQTANSGMALAKRLRPTAITLDLRLPDADGRMVLDFLKHEPTTRHIPVHVISADEARERMLRAGAVSFLQKPVAKEALENALARTIEFVNRPMKRLLIVEDDEVQRNALVELVGNGDVKSIAVGTAQQALEQLTLSSFDCIVVDLILPDSSGTELIRAMHHKLGATSPPVIVYTAKALSRQEETELRRLSDAIILKDARSPERLLDETALFLHRVQSKLPDSKRKLIEQVQRNDPALCGHKVLVIDDDVRNIFAITTALESYQMQVIYAESGRAGIELLQTQSDVSVVLMDVMLPEMDGFEATRQIRRMDQFKTLPIIMVTAKAMKGDREKCLAAGASDYITKPVDMDQLRSLLRVWLYR